jgi:hypothetical protein
MMIALGTQPNYQLSTTANVLFGSHTIASVHAARSPKFNM